MSTYYDAVDDIFRGRVGRKIGGASGDFPRDIAQLMPGEHLYMALTGFDQVQYSQVACVDTQREYREFYARCARGQYRSADLYALSEAEHARARSLCPRIALGPLR